MVGFWSVNGARLSKGYRRVRMDKGGDQAPLHDSLLVVMAKTPRAGEVKTRLIPPLTPEDAAAFHRACLIDTLEKVKGLSGVVPALAYTPDDTEAEFLELWPGELLRFPQSPQKLILRPRAGSSLNSGSMRFPTGGDGERMMSLAR